MFHKIEDTVLLSLAKHYITESQQITLKVEHCFPRNNRNYSFSLSMINLHYNRSHINCMLDSVDFVKKYYALCDFVELLLYSDVDKCTLSK